MVISLSFSENAKELLGEMIGNLISVFDFFVKLLNSPRETP